jgi:hypothetical protein
MLLIYLTHPQTVTRSFSQAGCIVHDTGIHAQDISKKITQNLFDISVLDCTL